jgi:hypothetical protein
MASRSASLLLALLLLAAASGRAEERLDLTALIAPLPEVGDYKVFVESGGEWVREEITAVEPVQSGWGIEKRYVDAEGDTTLVHEVVVPGIEAAASYADGGAGETPPFVAELASRARLRALSLSSERAMRVADRWIVSSFVLIPRRYKLRGRQRLAEFGPLETPYTSHPEAALVESRSRVGESFFAFGKAFANAGYRPTGRVDRRQVASWYVEGIGLVGERGVHRTSRRGRVREALAYEIWVQEGVIGGVPYPAPSP